MYLVLEESNATDNVGGDAMSDTYDSVYARWVTDPENFWAEAAEAVHWTKSGTRCSMTRSRRSIDGSPADDSIRVTTRSIATSKAAGRTSRR